MFISERFNVKEAATLSGAVGAVSTTLHIATAATNHNTRHPIVTASYATTMHRLTGGRFTLGLGRGIGPMTAALGLPAVTTAQLEDFAGVMRRLWHGETILGHDGPCGKYPFLRLDPAFDEDIPLGITAFGPNTLRLAGRAFDQVVLHTFFDDETLERCVRTVKEEAERVGRDPATVKVWSCLATIGDHLPEPVQLKKTVGRMATYLQAYGDLMVVDEPLGSGNHSPASAPIRSSPASRGRSTRTATTAELEHVATLIPESWLAPRRPDRRSCMATVQRQFDLGADGVILHGAVAGRARADRRRVGAPPSPEPTRRSAPSHRLSRLGEQALLGRPSGGAVGVPGVAPAVVLNGSVAAPASAARRPSRAPSARIASPVTKRAVRAGELQGEPGDVLGLPASGQGWNVGIDSRTRSSWRPTASGVWMRPGQMALTRMRCWRRARPRCCR